MGGLGDGLTYPLVTLCQLLPVEIACCKDIFFPKDPVVVPDCHGLGVERIKRELTNVVTLGDRVALNWPGFRGIAAAIISISDWCHGSHPSYVTAILTRNFAEIFPFDN